MFTIILAVAAFASGLFVGWFFFPAPKFIEEWWRPLQPPPTLGSSYANTPENMRPRKR